MKTQTFQRIGRLFIVLITLMIFTGGEEVQAQTLPAGVIAVDIDATSGGNDGTSWDDAFIDLQDAISYAVSNPNDVTEIWVAEGTYYPDIDDPGNRSSSFVLTNLNPATELRILGGFNGTETSESQRRWSGNVTILSGEINTGSINDNSYHVILAKPGEQDVIVDGFTITGGNADGTGGTHDDKGGGALLTGSIFDGPRFANCKFINNNAVLGGGIAAVGAYLNVRNSTFSNNTAEKGGGIYAGGGVVRNCIITTNVAEEEGGGIHGSPTLLNVSVVNNSVTDGNGGGIYANGCDIRSSYIADNTASGEGGGLYMMSGSVNLTNTAFVKNEAEGGTGGGARVIRSGNVINCTFAGNESSASSGAGLYWLGMTWDFPQRRSRSATPFCGITLAIVRKTKPRSFRETSPLT